LFSIEPLADRSYGLYAGLFDIRNHDGQFAPVAGRRGFPTDVSWAVRDAFVKPDHEAATASWIMARELAAVDWEVLEQWPPEISERLSPLAVGRVHPQRLGAYLTPGWRVLLKIIEDLTLRFGPDGVRLVVWFDQDT